MSKNDSTEECNKVVVDRGHCVANVAKHLDVMTHGLYARVKM
ncbi:hypothetical protein [Alteromonas gilva]|uniref:Uncharacterized protein n=1 Tax=Alteromonas gilva TaxID=2987522 RepID=A0ABT5L7Y6_9ALTE|nr:hypothetical protein [Alteromonas gilva]MDC8831893.1 hypothetical protein [Alteromonas gilva]